MTEYLKKKLLTFIMLPLLHTDSYIKNRINETSGISAKPTIYLKIILGLENLWRISLWKKL